MSSIGKDLATIRSHLGMSLEHIHQVTKIPVLTLKRVENDSIFTDTEENKTYIRSFVRTYAKALKIDDETAVEALDQYEAGSYSGLLIGAYPALLQAREGARKPGREGAPSDEKRPPKQTDDTNSEPPVPAGDENSRRDQEKSTGSGPESESTDGATAEKREDTAPGEVGKSLDTDDDPDKESSGSQAGFQESSEGSRKIPSDSADASPTDSPEPSTDPRKTPAGSSDFGTPDDRKPEFTEKSGEPASPASKAPDQGSDTDNNSQTPAPPTVSSVNWAAMGHKFKNIDRQTPGWLIAFIIFLIIAIVVVFLLYQQGILTGMLEGTQTETTGQTENSQSRPSELNFELPDDGETGAPGIEPNDGLAESAGMMNDVPLPELSDTLHITILAAYERLEPVRVWSDVKPSFNPYWMPPRNAYHFGFRDTIRIRGQFSRMQLYMNGHRIDNFRENHFVPAGNYVEITRSLFADDPQWRTTVPMELPDDTPSPTLVQNAPLF